MRRKRWVPLVLIWLGVIWLVQMSMAQAGGHHGVWIIGKRMDLGVLSAGEAAQGVVTVVNLWAGGLEVEAMPSCGCTVLEEARFVLGAFGWKRVPVRVETAGMEAGVHGKVLRLSFRRGREIWQEDVLLRFTVRKSMSPLEGVER
ncbi:MAG: hypothetical protein KatS3mg022_1571 [Armatimonadota bacterium]|nr:MAG: hypothetical protein KatS3mg022_1571 [Armatimonadota bacterium]